MFCVLHEFDTLFDSVEVKLNQFIWVPLFLECLIILCYLCCCYFTMSVLQKIMSSRTNAACVLMSARYTSSMFSVINFLVLLSQLGGLGVPIPIACDLCWPVLFHIGQLLFQLLDSLEVFWFSFTFACDCMKIWMIHCQMKIAFRLIGWCCHSTFPNVLYYWLQVLVCWSPVEQFNGVSREGLEDIVHISDVETSLHL